MAFFGNNNSYIPPIDATNGVGAALSQNAATPPKRSFFGKLANALGNDDAQMNFAAAAAYASGKPEVAAQIINATQQRRNELQMYEQRQKDARDNWLYEQQWKDAHPDPTELERKVAYYKSIGRPDLAEAATVKDAAIVQQVVDPTTLAIGVRAVDPRQLFPQQPGAAPGPAPSSAPPAVLTDADIMKMGGAAPSSGPGGFPFPRF
jgi:hypothetical protein